MDIISFVEKQPNSVDDVSERICDVDMWLEISRCWLKGANQHKTYDVNEWRKFAENWDKTDEGQLFIACLLSISSSIPLKPLEPLIPALCLVKLIVNNIKYEQLLPYVVPVHEEDYETVDLLLCAMFSSLDGSVENHISKLGKIECLRDIVNECAIVANKPHLIVNPISHQCFCNILLRRKKSVVKRMLEYYDISKIKQNEYLEIAYLCGLHESNYEKLRYILEKIPMIASNCIAVGAYSDVCIFEFGYRFMDVAFNVCDDDKTIAHAFYISMKYGSMSTLEYLCVSFLYTRYAPPSRRHVKCKELALAYFDSSVDDSTRVLLDMILDKYTFAGIASEFGVVPSLACSGQLLCREILRLVSTCPDRYTDIHAVAKFLLQFIHRKEYHVLSENESVFTIPILIELWELDFSGVLVMFKENVIVFPYEFLSYMRLHIQDTPPYKI